MPQVHPPAPPALADLLGTAVGELRRTERRRQHPVAVHAGEPGGVRARFDALWRGPAGRARAVPALDHAARRDVVGRLLDLAGGSGPGPLLWLSRPVAPEEPDEDRAWLAAGLAAAAERGLDPWWVVVTRAGWRDPRSGAAGR